MSARILDVTSEQYHDDPCATPSLSHSIAHILLTHSPRHAWLSHARLGGQARIATRAMDEGAILHKLLLDEGSEFDVLAVDDFKTKDARAERDDSIARGRIPIKVKDFERLHEAAIRLKQNAANQGFPLGLPGARSELAIEFTATAKKDNDVLCRCRFDQVRPDHVLYDIKKVRSASPKDLDRLIVESGMDIQAHAYSTAYEQLVEEALGRSDFVFLFCETEAPYEVVPARLDGVLREIGKHRWQKAVRLWRQLLDEGSFPWPGYCDGAITLSAPAWVVAQELPEEMT